MRPRRPAQLRHARALGPGPLLLPRRPCTPARQLRATNTLPGTSDPPLLMSSLNVSRCYPVFLGAPLWCTAVIKTAGALAQICLLPRHGDSCGVLQIPERLDRRPQEGIVAVARLCDVPAERGAREAPPTQLGVR